MTSTATTDMQALQDNYLDRLTREINKRSDKLIEIFLIGYFLFGVVIAALYDTWFIAIAVGGILLAIYFLSKKLFPDGNVNQFVASAVVGVYMGQFIYQTHGLFEMHFFAFIGATLLITYQNWKVQIPLAIVIVLHHALFGYLQYKSFLQNTDARVYFTQLNYMDLQTFIIHCFLAVIILTICCLWAIDMKKRTSENAKNIIAIEEMSSNFSKNLEFANMLAHGVYDQTTEVDSNDPFAAVLVELQSKLKRA
ncbi:hypothetical protein [Chryseolinea soli]|uniref:Methyl-accepting chemotaxis protein n=1 Tax=Chryseolinea soli TaxID=2321403 RepID=A0A385SNE2_9BACT|nr:hypothetical protein [Chryseolinea soli]AYB31871.1 hypothetical protein D4L85_15450 [Chryseolinea soli]